MKALTREIADPSSPVAQFFKERLPNVRPVMRDFSRQVQGASTLRPSPARVNPPWGTIGTAIDYRLRYYFAVTPYFQLVAALGAEMLQTPPFAEPHPRLAVWDGDGYLKTDRPGIYVLIPELAAEFFTSLENGLDHAGPVGRRLDEAAEDSLCQYCYVLALFEQIFRHGTQFDSPLYTLRPGDTVDTLLGLVEDWWVEDLRQLSWLFYDRQQALLSRPTVLNPTFAGSRDIGGADADLIVDGCLIDIKATINPKLDARWLYQLLGYVLLDYDDEYQIRAVGIYLARQGELIRWPLDGLLATLAASEVSLRELRDLFQRLLVHANAPVCDATDQSGTLLAHRPGTRVANEHPEPTG